MSFRNLKLSNGYSLIEHNDHPNKELSPYKVTRIDTGTTLITGTYEKCLMYLGAISLGYSHGEAVLFATDRG